MKILYCIPSLSNPGGMERVITEKVNFLSQLSGYEITIVTTDQNGNSINFRLDEKIKLVHFNIDFEGHYSESLLKKYISHKQKLKIYKQKLTQLLNQLEVDICISFCGKEIEFLADLPVKCKKIAEIHFAMNFRKQFITSRHNGYIWNLLGEIRTQQLKRVTKGLDKLIVLTKADQAQWEQSHKNVIQIPNPNPLDNKESSTLLNKRVLSVGKLDAQKGFDMLIEVWALVAAKHPDWILDIFGEGDWKLLLQNRINELNLNNQIKLRGKTSDIVSYYLDSSIYVMSSRYEGLPMVLIEAMSCGLPIVSFDCECGPREVITDGKDGFLVEPNNIKLLAEKICVLIENEIVRKQMGVNALLSVNRYAKEPIMKKWIDLFEKTCITS